MNVVIINMIKKIVKILFIFTICFSFVTKVFAANDFNKYNIIMDIDYSTDYNRDDDMNTNCQDFAPALKTVGIIIIIIKILIPLIIIVKSSINFLSIVMSGEQSELKKQAQKLGNALIASVLIFFIPKFVDAIFSFVENYSESSDAKICRACLFDPYDPSCTNYADKAGN